MDASKQMRLYFLIDFSLQKLFLCAICIICFVQNILSLFKLFGVYAQYKLLIIFGRLICCKTNHSQSCS